MERAGCGKIFREKVSGGNRDRPQFQRIFDQIRVGDTIVVCGLFGIGSRLVESEGEPIER